MMSRTMPCNVSTAVYTLMCGNLGESLLFALVLLYIQKLTSVAAPDCTVARVHEILTPRRRVWGIEEQSHKSALVKLSGTQKLAALLLL